MIAAGSPALGDLRDDIGFTELNERLGERPPLPSITYVSRGETNWQFRKGLSEPSSDPETWRAPDFAIDATWETATLPIGYGDGDDATVLADMRRSYQSIFLRKSFEITEQVPTALLLHLYLDDGAVVWINGTEIARRHVPDGTLSITASAENHEAEWERVLLSPTDDYLVEGTNTIAVHAINQSATSSDFSFDLELVTPRVTVAQVEATIEFETPPNSGNFEYYFLPQAYSSPTPVEPEAIGVPARGESFAGTGDFSGTRIRVQTSSDSLSYSASSHARSVGATIYGNGSSFPDLNELECYAAGDWIDRIIAPNSLSPPGAGIEWLQNHSWVQTSTDDTEFEEIEDALMRIDHDSERDSVLSIVGLNNGSGTQVPPLMASAFNVISVGRSDGEHSRGGTLAPYSQPGRVKPELVAPLSRTSYSTAAVTSAAAFLIDEVFRRLDTHALALRPEVMKSVLLAGATQRELVNWSRSPEMPLDPIFGVGELNLSRSHHILTRGENQTSESAPTIVADWAAETATPDKPTTFRFQIPLSSQGTRLTAALCWNRQVDNLSTGAAFRPIATLPDMSLTLTSDSSPDVIMESSNASIGNVEFIVREETLPSGTYDLNVQTDLVGNFGIAWIVDTAPDLMTPPEVMLIPRLQVDVTNERFSLALLNLIPGETYRLERSLNMRIWESVSEFVAEEGDSTWEVQTTEQPVYFRLLLLPDVQQLQGEALRSSN